MLNFMHDSLRLTPNSRLTTQIQNELPSRAFFELQAPL
jgi:hypothetical protein